MQLIIFSSSFKKMKQHLIMLTLSAFFFSSLFPRLLWYQLLPVFAKNFEHSCSVSSGFFSQSSILIVFLLYLLSLAILSMPRFLCSVIFWIPSLSMLVPQPQLLSSLTLKVFSSSPVPIWINDTLFIQRSGGTSYTFNQQLSQFPCSLEYLPFFTF